MTTPDSTELPKPANTGIQQTTPIAPGGPGEGLAPGAGGPGTQAAPFSLEKGAGAGTETPTSVMNLYQQQNAGAGSHIQATPTADSLVQQAQEIQNKMSKAKELLSTPGAQFTPSQNDILLSHLDSVHESLAALSARLRLTPAPKPINTSNMSGPVYLLHYLTGSQNSLTSLSQEMSANPPSSPSALMAVQVKMMGVQQQMEFFTVMLSKVLEDVKTVFNIQN